MKKIAFVSSGFTGSIMPLIQKFLDDGFCVDLYLRLFKTQNQYEFEALEQKYKSFGYGVHFIPNQYVVGLNDKFKTKNFRFFLVCEFGFGQSFFVKRIIAWILQMVLSFRTICKIKKEKYDFINVVGHGAMDAYISNRLRRFNVCQTFHETYDHAKKKTVLKSVENAIKAKIPIVLPSQHLQSVVRADYPDALLHVIPFGLFENYTNFYKGEKLLRLPPKYILFLGNLLPYKGLDLLIKAYERIVKNGKSIKIVVAGNGRSELLNIVNDNNDFVVLNRWITNQEFAELIARSQGLVCPYHSASQSGLPSVAYLFRRKVIATDVGGMAEYIKEPICGYLVPPNNIEVLSKYMSNMFDHDDFMDENSANYVMANMGWDQIKNMYKEIFLR